MALKITVGSNIRRLREFAGLSQIELAEKIGISRSAIATAEGFRTIPNVETLERIAELFGVPVLRLFATVEEQEVLDAAKEARIHPVASIAEIRSLQEKDPIHVRVVKLEEELTETQRIVSDGLAKAFPEIVELMKKVGDLEKRVEELEAERAGDPGAERA